MATTLKAPADRQKLNQLLQPYIQSGVLGFLLGSGASLPAIKTAGPIEAEINELLKDGKENDARAKAFAFLDGILAQHGSIDSKEPTGEVAITLAAYTEFVATVDRVLFERKNDLIPRQANIFTTNYDLFIETAASKIATVLLNDGFLRTAGVGNEFPFAPECYFDRVYRSGAVYSRPAELPTINLIKMHGSLSWKNKEDALVYGAMLPKRLDKDTAKDPAKVAAYLEEFFLVLPNVLKFHSAMMDRTYYDLLRIFANVMERENAVLISFGFSFQDEHILDITRRALRNPTAQLIIVAYDAASVPGYQKKFEHQRNAAILVPEEGQTYDFSKFNQLLQAAIPSGT